MAILAEKTGLEIEPPVITTKKWVRVKLKDGDETLVANDDVRYTMNPEDAPGWLKVYVPTGKGIPGETHMFAIAEISKISMML